MGSAIKAKQLVLGLETCARGPIYKLPITVPAVNITEDLTSFYLPVQVTIPVSHWMGSAAASDSLGNPLPIKVVSFDSGTGHLDTIVRTNLSAEMDTTIYLLYGAV